MIRLRGRKPMTGGTGMKRNTDRNRRINLLLCLAVFAAMSGFFIMLQNKFKGIQSGLEMVKLADIMCSELFIDRSEGSDSLGVEEDDIEAAIGDSVLLCKDIIEKGTETLGMKGE